MNNTSSKYNLNQNLNVYIRKFGRWILIEKSIVYDEFQINQINVYQTRITQIADVIHWNLKVSVYDQSPDA